METQNTKPTFTLEHAMESNTKCVYKLAHKYSKKQMGEFEDFVQEGFLGIADAYNRYDSSRLATPSTKFLSYAYSYIRQYMLKYANNQSKLINFTSFVGDNDYESDQLNQKYGTDTITFDHVPQENDNRSRIMKLVNSGILTERELVLINKRYLADIPMILSDLAVIFKCSVPNVKLIETRALNKLKTSF